LEAIAVRSNKGAVDLIPYQLLTRDSDGPRKLEQLRGKRIAIASRTHSDMGLAWLETQLADGKLGPARDFFESISLSYKGSSCVLPLFFGKVDACVLDARSYQLMQELNPQLSKLKVLASSEPLLEGLVAMPKSGHRYRAEIIDAIMTLHRDPAGAQMVMFFQSGAMLPAKAQYFEATRALWERYLKLGVRGTRSSQADRTGGLP
jgi:ABC-type phosphate/phosphonate transport system substrate-binding protein